MKAAFIEAYGEPDVLRYGELPPPNVDGDKILVDVHACSVNRADHLVRAGASGRPVNFPHVLGKDLITGITGT